MPSKTAATDKEYEKVGRALESVIVSGYASESRAYRINFWRGVFFGLGAAIGGTIVVTSILVILTLFTDIPFVGDIARTIRDSLEESQ